MDPAAHTLLGATLAEAGLKKKTALATATLIIGANIPDLDAIAMLVGSDYALLVRRGWTHGILALLFWPFLVAGLMLLTDRIFRQPAGKVFTAPSRIAGHRSGHGHGDTPPVRPGWLLILSFVAVWSHPFLDWLNTYGIRLLMPFDDRWFYGDILFIIDPWIWLLLAASVVLTRSDTRPGMAAWIILGSAATLLVSTAEPVPKTAKIVWLAGIAIVILLRRYGRFRLRPDRVAGVCLVIVSVYLMLMFAASQLTVVKATRALSERGVTVDEVMAEPLPARFAVRNGVARSGDRFYLFRVNWLTGELSWRGRPLYSSGPDVVIRSALSAPGVAGLRNWIRFPYYEAHRTGYGWRVEIRDLRYVEPGREAEVTIGYAVVKLDHALQPLQ